MGETIKFVPESERKERREKIQFPSITEMYEELDRIRRTSSGKALVAGIADSGEVGIDQDFKPLGRIRAQNVEGNKTEITDIIGEVDIPDFDDVYHGGSQETASWNKKFVGMDELLHFNFGQLHITLEGRPIYQVRDYKSNNRGRVRWLALDEEEANNPSYVFSISEEGGESFRVQVSPDGTIKVLDSHLENTYKDKMTGKETLKPRGHTEKIVQEKMPVFEEVPLTLRELLTKVPIKQLLKGRRTARKKVSEEIRPVPERSEHFNEFIGGPTTEIKLGKNRPAKYDMAVMLTTLLKEGIRALEEAEQKSGKIQTF